MDFVEIIELVGVVAFAMSGVLVGIEYGFDMFGIFVLAFLTALGGGLVRDMVLGARPPVCFAEPAYIICVAVTVAVALIFLKIFDSKLAVTGITRLKTLINFFDAIGLGIFAITGTECAMKIPEFASNPLLCVACGLLTSIVGGMMRDVLATRKPVVLRKEIYALAALIGSILYYYVKPVWDDMAATYICALIVVVIRMVSLHRGINVLFKIRNKNVIVEADDDFDKKSDK